MKIAVPVRNGHVDEHFGHAGEYSVITISPTNRIIHSEIITADQGCGCKSGIAETLGIRGVTVMLAGNMGAGAVRHMYINGIDVIRGCSGSVEEVVKDFLEGKLTDNNQVCHQHEGCDDNHHGHHHE